MDAIGGNQCPRATLQDAEIGGLGFTGLKACAKCGRAFGP